MEVKPRYKQTEVGVVPEDWHTRPCLAVSDVITVGIVVRPTQYYAKQGVPALRSANIRVGGIDDQDMVCISEKTNALLSKSQVRAGDVLTVRTGYPGTSAVVPPNFAGANCIDILITRPSKAINSHYLAAWINSSFGKSQVLRNQGGLAQQHFNVADLRTLVVALPPTKAEQDAIAEALSDADALVESLDQLLVKKRQLKQGAMQELLSGKKRLPGFEVGPGYKQTDAGVIPEDWDTPELGSVLKSMQLGGNYKNSERKTSWPLIKMGNLGRGSIKLDKLEFIDRSQPPASRDRLRRDDLLFNTRNTLDLVGKVALWRDELPEAYFNSNIMRMGFDETRVASRPFMNYILNTPQTLANLRGIAIGTTSVAAIYSRDLVGLKIPLPFKAEQEAIATILSDIDAEIDALEVKLAKARQLKQGMMQELLTGRIRLV